MQKFIVLICICFIVINSSGQNNEDKKPRRFKSIIKEIEKLNYYNLKQCSNLYKIDFKIPSSGDKIYFIGWIMNENAKNLSLLNIDGFEQILYKVYIDSILQLKNYGNLNKQDYARNYYINSIPYNDADIMPYLLISLWLYQTHNKSLAKEIITKLEYSRRINYHNIKVAIRNTFGYLYYEQMLEAYTRERNYKKVIKFGNYISHRMSKDFTNREQAIKLLEQLKIRKNDFISFNLPDSIAWNNLKKQLSRNEQLKYLIERLRLLNCHNPIISLYSMNYDYSEKQTSISYDSLWKYYDYDYKHRHEKIKTHEVINPYVEILSMKPSKFEIENLLPYLLDESFIPTYVSDEDHGLRELFKFNQVIADLINKITKKNFIEFYDFDELTPEKKVQKIESIKKWCEEHRN